jgi:uncharacterized membrane protein YciS (DUF1049 family)
MDSEIISTILREGAWAAGLFLVAAVLFYCIVAGSNVFSLASAIGRSVLSFIFSPWKYLRKTIGELSLGAENPRLLDTDHYLLNRFISNLQVALILLVVFGVGVVVTAAVHAMLPPFYLRQQLAQTQKSLTAAQGSLQTTSTQVKQQDNDWQTRRAELISKAEDEHRQKVKTVQDSMRSDEAAIRGNAEAERTLASIKAFFSTRQGYADAAEQAKAFVQRLPSLSESATGSLVAYSDHWAQLQSLTASAPRNSDDIRTKVQPDHAQLVQDMHTQTAAEERLQTEQRDLEGKVSAGYEPQKLLLTLLSGGLILLLWVWGAGLSIELLSMGFYLSNDVKRIRAQGENERGASATAGGTA